MKKNTTRFLDRLRCENMCYYTIEEGKGAAPDVVIVAYFADKIYDMRISFSFYEDFIEARISGLESVPLYKKESLIDGVNALYIGHKWLEFNVDMNVIIAKIDTSFGIDDASDVCYDIIDKISGVVGRAKRGGKYVW